MICQYYGGVWFSGLPLHSIKDHKENICKSRYKTAADNQATNNNDKVSFLIYF